MIEGNEYRIITDKSSEHLGDCLELMKLIPDKSIDMIICDLPYGTTRNKWDCVIDLYFLWIQYERIIKNNGAIVLFSDSIFTAKLMLSNEKIFRYELIWNKVVPSGFLNANIMPMRIHENILVFYKKLPIYNKQMQPRSSNAHSLGNNYTKSRGEQPQINYGIINDKKSNKVEDYSLKNPDSILRFTKGNGRGKHKRIHPTQKPLPLIECLIKTYSNKGDTILDNAAGVFTTAIGCLNTGRNYIVMEKEKEYYNKGVKRILKWKKDKSSRLF